MSKVFANSADVNKSPHNLSKTKQLYSFPKSPRFANSLPQCDRFYEMGNTLSSRSTTLGIGERFLRSTITSATTPSPLVYQKPAPFSTAKNQHAYTFGLAREAFQKVYVPESPPVDKIVPGPGTYKVKDVFGSEGRRWSIRIKPGKKASSVQPGPGAYDSPRGLSPEGKYHWSKYKDSGSAALKSYAKRFVEDGSRRLPGPGQYKEPATINSEGRNYISRFRSSYSRTFANAERKIELGGGNKDTPGPGSYRFPSEFGVYEAMEDFKARRKYNSSSKVLKKAGETSVNGTKSTKEFL